MLYSSMLSLELPLTGSHYQNRATSPVSKSPLEDLISFDRLHTRGLSARNKHQALSRLTIS